MSELVCQREDAVEIVVVVHEDVRIGFVRAERVCAGFFAFLRIDVDPIFVKCTLDDGDVFFSEGLDGAEHHFFRLFVGDLAIVVREGGHVDVVHVHLVHAEHFFLEFVVFVQSREMFAHARNERVVDFAGDVVCIECKIARTLVMAKLRLDAHGFDIGVERRRDRLDVTRVDGVIFLKRLFPERLVSFRQNRHEIRLCEFDFVRMLLEDGERHIGVGEHIKRVLGCVSDIGCLRENVFLFFGERVRSHARETIHVFAVRFERLVVANFLPRFFRETEEIRIEERELRRNLADHAFDAQSEFLLFGDRTVFVAFHKGIGDECLEFHRDVVDVIHDGEKVLLGIFFEFDQFFRLFFDMRDRRFDSRVIRIDFFEIPFIFHVITSFPHYRGKRMAVQSRRRAF